MANPVKKSRNSFLVAKLMAILYWSCSRFLIFKGFKSLAKCLCDKFQVGFKGGVCMWPSALVIKMTNDVTASTFQL